MSLNSGAPRSATRLKKVNSGVTISVPLSTPQKSSSYPFSPTPVIKPRTKRSSIMKVSEAKIDEAVVPEVIPPEVIPHEAVVPEVIPSEAVVPEVIPSEAVVPEVIPSEAVVPEVIPPEAVVPEVIPPEVISPEVIPPEVIPPEAVVPETKPALAIAKENFIQSPTIPDVFLIQDVTVMTDGEKRLYRETMLSYFQVMQNKINEKEYATPIIPPGSSLDEELTIYQYRMYIYVKRMSIESKIERYKLYLTFFWGMMELYGIANGFLLMKGYTKMQLKIIGCYDDILKELGTIQYSKEERKVVKQEEEEQGPFAKLLWSSLFNGILIMAFQYLSSFVSKGEGVNILGTLVDSVFNKNKPVVAENKSMMSGIIKGALEGLLPEKYLSLVDTFVIPLISGDGIVSSGSARQLEVEDIPAEATLL